MTAQLIPTPVFRGWDNNGNPLIGGQLFTYGAGTTTPLATWTDSTQATQNTNPVILNARGEANVWLDINLNYKMVLQDSSGNQIWAIDNVNDAAGTGGVFNADVFTTSANQAVFTLSTPPVSTNAVTASLDGAVLVGIDDFTLIGKTLTLNVAARAGQRLRVAYVANAGSLAIPNGSVTDASLAVGSIIGSINATYVRNAGEIAAGIIPTNFGYQPFNVLRYGADPTGAVSSLAAFNAAFTAAMAATPHGAIYAPRGTYLIPAPGLLWTNQADINLYGDGPDQTTLQGSNSAAYTILTISADTGGGTTGINLKLTNFAVKNSGLAAGTNGVTLADYLGVELDSLLIQASGNALSLKGMANITANNLNTLTWESNAASNTALALGLDSAGIGCGPAVFNGCEFNGQGAVTTGAALATSKTFCVVFNAVQFVGFGPSLQSVLDIANADDITLINCYSESSSNTTANGGTMIELGRVAANVNFNVIGGHWFNGITKFLNTFIHSVNLGNLTVIGGTFANFQVGAISYSTGAGTQVTVISSSAPGGAAKMFDPGVTGAPTTTNVAFYAFPAQTTGFGAPTGAVTISNFPGATATLVQTSETVAAILNILIARGWAGA